MHNIASDSELVGGDNHAIHQEKERDTYLIQIRGNIPFQKREFESPMTLSSIIRELIQYHMWDKFCKIPTNPANILVV